MRIILDRDKMAYRHSHTEARWLAFAASRSWNYGAPNIRGDEVTMYYRRGWVVL